MSWYSDKEKVSEWYLRRTGDWCDFNEYPEEEVDEDDETTVDDPRE